jgi:CheY-like chemotaxis protein/two-component sensor histidine kinase
MIRQLGREQLTDKQVYYVKQAESSASHLLTILNNILDIAKIESGELLLYNNDFVLTSLVHNVHSILFTQAREKNLEFRLHIGQDVLPVLIGDEVRIRQVLINLAGNAIKFTERGNISLFVHVVENAIDHQVIGFEVSDTGIGMSEAFVKRIFEKFSQEQDAADRKFEGTGLGMSIANDLVKLMGGTLEVESVKNKGTRCSFSLKLPVGDQTKLSSKNIRVEKAFFPESSVLLVEDNEMNRFIAVQSLGHIGCNVEEAGNGQDALELLKNKQFDLILMDIQMPVMDGLQTTQIIRQKLQSDIPIIALTANAFRHDIDAYLAKGMNDFIIKPYDEQDFLRKVAHYLNLSRLASLKNKNEKNAGNEIEYNLAFLEKMSQGNQAFINKMLNIFCNLVISSIGAFEKAIEKNDVETINKTAHKIKPSVEQMGISVLKEPVLKLEKYNLEKGSIKELQALVDNTNSILRAVIEQIKEKELN